MTAPSSMYSGAYAPISSFNATSSDLVTIAAGPQTFNIQSGKTFLAGMGIQILSLSTNNLMAGSVTSYSGTVLVVNVTSTIGSGTFSDWQITLAGSPGAQGATGSTGAAGSNGTNGTDGKGYLATSTDSRVTAGSGSVAFATQANLAYSAGARIRATSAGTGEWMEGVVSSYASNTLTVTMDSNSGTGTHADWNINLAGQAGANGSGVAGQTVHRVVIAATATTLAAGVLLGGNQLLVGAAGADPVAATVSGDLTNSVGVFTIANLAVTYAKMQNVSATNRVLGRITAGAGSPEELTGANVTTIIGGNLSTLQAPGNWKVFYSDGSGVFTALAVGAAGTSLVGNGATAAPSFAAWATTAQYQGNSSNAILATNNVWTAAGLTTLTDAVTVAVDLSAGLNFTVTLAGNRTLGNPTNTKVGQSGVIEIIQDGTGTRTLSYASNYKFIGGQPPTLSTAAGTKDYLTYFVVDSTHINASLMRAVA